MDIRRLIIAVLVDQRYTPCSVCGGSFVLSLWWRFIFVCTKPYLAIQRMSPILIAKLTKVSGTHKTTSFSDAKVFIG